MPTWTMEETEIAREMLKRHAHNREFRAVLGRNKDTCKQRIDRLANVQLPLRATPIVVPENIWEERNQRLMAASRDLSGSVFKDPPTGYSALDKQRGRPVGNPSDPRWAWAIRRGGIRA